MKKICFLIVSMILLVSCSQGGLSQATSISPSVMPPTAVENMPNPTAVPQVGSELPTQLPADTDTPAPVVEEKATPTASPAPIAIGDISVYIPDSWTSTVVEVDPIMAIIFANRLPSDFQSPEKTAESFPAGFVSGGIVLSPMAEATNSSALFAGMMENLPKYRNEDFQAMLMTADQVGLIDLAAVESVTLSSARADKISANQALVMEGTVKFPDGKEPVQTQIWLSWSGSNFVTYYRFAAEGVSPEDNQELEKIGSSIKIPAD